MDVGNAPFLLLTIYHYISTNICHLLFGFMQPNSSFTKKLMGGYGKKSSIPYSKIIFISELMSF